MAFAPVTFTFSELDIYNSAVVDQDDHVYYVTCTPQNMQGSGVSSISNKSSASLYDRQNIYGLPRSRRNALSAPTVVARPKSAHSEAQIVSSLIWHSWEESIFCSRTSGKRLRLSKLLPLRSPLQKPTFERTFQAPTGEWRWYYENGELVMDDSRLTSVVRFDERPSGASDDLRPRLIVDPHALAHLDLIITSMLVFVQDLRGYQTHSRSGSQESMYSTLDSAYYSPTGSSTSSGGASSVQMSPSSSSSSSRSSGSSNYSISPIDSYRRY